MNPWHDHLCKLLGIYASCEGIENMERLEIDLGDNIFHKIPFQTVSYAKKEVVTCVAPLFAAERWQQLIFASHIHRRFGSFLHIYIRSIIRPVYELTQLYEKEGYLKLQPWLRIKYSSFPEYMFNANQHMAFRSQESAQTDCLLQYKESAEFITFVDLDDILIPRIGATYAEEFSQHLHGYDYVHYEKQNVVYQAGLSPKTFSLDPMFRSMRFAGKYETGKFVTRPEFVNYTAIHYPTMLHEIKGPNGLGNVIPRELNVLIHLKHMNTISPAKDQHETGNYIFNENIGKIFNEEDINAIESDFKNLSSRYPATFSSLPSSTFYIQHFEACYHKKYYQHWNYGKPERITYCTNPDVCKVPQKVKISCANADGVYSSTDHGTVINVHYAMSKGFTIGDRCLP